MTDPDPLKLGDNISHPLDNYDPLDGLLPPTEPGSNCIAIGEQWYPKHLGELEMFTEKATRKGSFPRWMGKRLKFEAMSSAVAYNEGESLKGAPMKLIEKGCITAEEQLAALRFFHKCLLEAIGDEEGFKKIGARKYRPLTEDEQGEIKRLWLSGETQKAIAKKLGGRHVSTVHYFIRKTFGSTNREKLSSLSSPSFFQVYKHCL